MAAALVVPGQAVPSAPRDLVAAAGRDLESGDGIAAETRLRQALAQGVARTDVAALMGEALLDQGDAARARDWLGPAQFSPATAARGWRALGRLERAGGNLPAASRAYDEALRAAPGDAVTWIEVAYLRFALGNHLDGIDAIERALALAPGNVRVLEAKGNLVRDQFGLVAALPWYEAALQVAPDDLPVLGAYAATLGELDRARDMLAVTRRMLAIERRNPHALYFQAVLAARAGNVRLGRALLARGAGGLARVPGAMLLSAALDLAAGYPETAITTLDALLERQPGNVRARELHASALAASGMARQVIARHGMMADDPAASPYILTVLARANEALGDRASAAPLLDRGARNWSRPMVPVRGNPVGELLASGQGAAAAQQARAATEANPASGAAAAMAGDVALAQGRAADAAAAYAKAARVRMADGLLLNATVALEVAGRGGEASRLVDAVLRQSPTSRAALWLSAAIARREGDWPRAAVLLDALHDRGGAGDINLALALSEARARSGDAAGALPLARQAYRAQPGSGLAASGYAAVLQVAGQPAPAKALVAKAAVMGARHSALPPVRYAFAPPH